MEREKEMSYTYSEYKYNLEYSIDGLRRIAPVFHLGDEVFHIDYGFGVIKEFNNDNITAEYDDGIHTTDYEYICHGKFNSYDEAMQYNDHCWPLTMQYHDAVVPELKVSNGSVLYPCYALDESVMKKPRIEIFRSDLEMLNFEGISLSLEENCYLPYWRMTQRLTREEFDAVVNLLRSPFTDPFLSQNHYSSGWECCAKEWNFYHDYMMEKIPDYDFDTL